MIEETRDLLKNDTWELSALLAIKRDRLRMIVLFLSN